MLFCKFLGAVFGYEWGWAATLDLWRHFRWRDFLSCDFLIRERSDVALYGIPSLSLIQLQNTAPNYLYLHVYPTFVKTSVYTVQKYINHMFIQERIETYHPFFEKP